MTQPPDDELPGMWEQADFIDTRDAPPTPSITCPKCHRTSHHPMDIREGWCGNCHAQTSPSHTGNTVPLEDFVHMVQQLAYEDGVPREDLPGFTPDPIHPPTQGS